MPEMKLDVVDAAELAELLQFLSQWLARDPARLGDSLAQFVGHPAYGLAHRDQPARYAGPENSEGGGFAAADSLRCTAGAADRSGI